MTVRNKMLPRLVELCKLRVWWTFLSQRAKVGVRPLPMTLPEKETDRSDRSHHSVTFKTVLGIGITGNLHNSREDRSMAHKRNAACRPPRMFVHCSVSAIQFFPRAPQGLCPNSLPPHVGDCPDHSCH